MPFVLSKAIWLVAQPSSVMILMVIAGALMAGSARARWATRGRRLALAGGLLLTAAGLLPGGSGAGPVLVEPAASGSGEVALLAGIPSAYTLLVHRLRSLPEFVSAVDAMVTGSQ